MLNELIIKNKEFVHIFNNLLYLRAWNMNKTKGIQGTPWHKEFLQKDESDPKRHKSKCYYYEKQYGDKKSYCRLLGTRCGTSSFCENYKEIVKQLCVRFITKKHHLLL